MHILLYFVLSFGLSWEYKSSRSLALGGVGATIKDPQTSFFMNPAGMRGLKSLDLISFEFQLSEALIFELINVKQILNSISDKKNLNLSNAKRFFGKEYGINFFYFPHFIANVKKVSFGLGVLAGTGVGFRSVLPSNITFVDNYVFSGILPVLGWALAVLDDSIEIGISIVPLEASAVSRFDFRQNELIAFDKIFPAVLRGEKIIQDVIKARCLYPLRCAFDFGGFNAGLIWNPVWLDDLSVGLNVRDVADPIRKTTADAGLSYKGKLYNVRYSLFLDFQDFVFSQSGKSDILTHIFTGTEISLQYAPERRFISAMFGISQLNLSAGFELNLKVISILVGTFSQEMRNYVGRSNIRYYFFKLAI